MTLPQGQSCSAICGRTLQNSSWHFIICHYHFLFSLGKLEEEFEKKFNSLPQYSPMTFDKKGTAVAKKKKADSCAVQEEAFKAGKGDKKTDNLTHPHYYPSI